MDIQGIREGALFAMHNMQDVWSFPLISCFPAYIQGEIAIRSYDSTGTTIEHYLGNAEEFYPDEHPQILEREVGYIFPLMEVEPTICIELKDEG